MLAGGAYGVLAKPFSLAPLRAALARVARTLHPVQDAFSPVTRRAAATGESTGASPPLDAMLDDMPSVVSAALGTPIAEREATSPATVPLRAPAPIPLAPSTSAPAGAPSTRHHSRELRRSVSDTSESMGAAPLDNAATKAPPITMPESPVTEPTASSTEVLPAATAAPSSTVTPTSSSSPVGDHAEALPLAVEAVGPSRRRSHTHHRLRRAGGTGHLAAVAEAVGPGTNGSEGDAPSGAAVVEVVSPSHKKGVQKDGGAARTVLLVGLLIQREGSGEGGGRRKR